MQLYLYRNTRYWSRTDKYFLNNKLDKLEIIDITDKLAIIILLIIDKLEIIVITDKLEIVILLITDKLEIIVIN